LHKLQKSTSSSFFLCAGPSNPVPQKHSAAQGVFVLYEGKSGGYNKIGNMNKILTEICILTQIDE